MKNLVLCALVLWTGVLVGACSGADTVAAVEDGGGDEGSTLADATADVAVDSDSPDASNLDGSSSDAQQDGARDATPRDARSDADAGACTTLVNNAPAITPTVVAGNPPPALGGVLVDGTYFLTAATFYVASPSDAGASSMMQSTLKLTGGTLELAVLAKVGGAELRLAFAVAPNLTALGMTQTCPKPKSEDVHYTAVGNDLTLYSGPGGGEALKFTRQP